MIAIVVAYNNGVELKDCCQHLAELVEIDHVIIVDNSYHMVGSCVDAVGLKVGGKIVHAIPPRNLGFSGGNNFGISLAREMGARKILICNPDVIVGPHVLAGLLDEMDSRSLDLISPFMREAGGGGHGLIDLKRPGWDLWLGRGVLDIPTEPSSRRYLSTFYGACFVICTDLLDRIGSLSEDFFLYSEELDFCRRIDERGHRWGVSAEHGVFHARGSSISPSGGPLKSYTSLHHSSRSAVVVGRKYWPLLAVWWTAVRAGWALLMFVRGKRGASAAVMRGVGAGWKAALS